MQKNTKAGTHASRLMLGLLALLAMLLAGCLSSTDTGSQLAADQTFIWPDIGVTSVDDIELDPANADLKLKLQQHLNKEQKPTDTDDWLWDLFESHPPKAMPITPKTEPTTRPKASFESPFERPLNKHILVAA